MYIMLIKQDENLPWHPPPMNQQLSFSFLHSNPIKVQFVTRFVIREQIQSVIPRIQVFSALALQSK